MPDIQTTHLPMSACPSCGKVLDAASSLQGRKPKAGDVSICLECANVGIFDADLTLRRPTKAEKRHIHGDVRIMRMRAAILGRRRFQ